MSPDVIEVCFKRNRKGYFFNSRDISLTIGDYVAVEVEKGEDLGQVSQTGRLVMLKDIKQEPGVVLRAATDTDMERLRITDGMRPRLFLSARTISNDET